MSVALLSLALFPSGAHAALIGELQQTSPLSVQYVAGTDFVTFTDDGNAVIGDVTALLQAVPGTGDVGDFAGFIPGRIALISRGASAFFSKVNNAATAGAVGAIIYDNVAQPIGGVSFGSATTIPALFTTQALGQQLLDQLDSGPVELHLLVRIPEPSSVTLASLALGCALFPLVKQKRRALPQPQRGDRQ